MSPPSLVKKELPWIQDARNDNAPGPLDFDYTIEELSAPGSSILSVREQIAGIDNASNPHFNELLERYPVDNHPSFPGKRIFHNEMGYFDLNDVKLRVWAVAMAKQTSHRSHSNTIFASACRISFPHSRATTLSYSSFFPLCRQLPAPITLRTVSVHIIILTNILLSEHLDHLPPSLSPCNVQCRRPWFFRA
ncbi:hypothetical protein B0H14DRAFT_3485674 [Mycena olivaceomarginata]|nr:hypothetical protein B0H14DRAFT_3485674 [Mycena olivaceomarginata]